MISWKISLDLAVLARFLWLRYAMYFFATSFLGLFISSISTRSWISSTLILSCSVLDILAAISAARTMSSPASVTSIAFVMASMIFFLSNSTTLPSRLITFFIIVQSVLAVCPCARPDNGIPVSSCVNDCITRLVFQPEDKGIIIYLQKVKKWLKVINNQEKCLLTV